MRKIILLLCTLISTSVYADELKSFSEIYNSIKAGKTIRMIIDFSLCNPSFSNLIIATSPTNGILLKDDVIQFANSPLTTNNPSSPGAVLENVTYKITNNNELNIVTRIIKLPDYSQTSERSSVCHLGTAVKILENEIIK